MQKIPSDDFYQQVDELTSFGFAYFFERKKYEPSPGFRGGKVVRGTTFTYITTAFPCPQPFRRLPRQGLFFLLEKKEPKIQG
ncbi:hypothetical protein [Sphingobacterium suaedae]|uniref:hypothetical protein n=1 Tax=Sphingobacterium suaedae TaxID=1686402 RepID=UPI0036D3077C